MTKSVLTISGLLAQELEHRCYATDIALKTTDLFSREKLIPWIEALVGRSTSGKLSHCIRHTPTPRLSHTAAVYLLGMALRSNLNLHFDKLPRLVSFSTSDGFHFYWAMTCLCHDLGYTFEHLSKKDKSFLRCLSTNKGQLKALGIEYSLFRVDRKELLRLGIAPDSKDGQWILETVDLAKKYDRYRRQTNHTSKYPAVADHGICGALLLYDILRREYTDMKLRRKLRRFEAKKRHAAKTPKGNLDGATKDSSPRRFILSSLLIACTVARHNMWLASKPEDQNIYRIYGMDKLFSDYAGAKIHADLPMEQMLFFLDFVDTIDPVKSFYLRDVEDGPRKGESRSDHRVRLQQQLDFVMKRVSIDFTRAKEHCFSLTAAPTESWETDTFQHFIKSACTLPDWLDITTPTGAEDRITFQLPFAETKKDNWPCGITDQEVNSLLLYMGCGVPGLYGPFYSSSRAYQTLNLLMMEGQDGEKIRVCIERQKPSGLFLSQWARSLETMEDIFRAQCKYAVHPDTPPMEDTLYRSDRKLNFKLMQNHHATYAMTSTSRGSYLNEFLVDKVDPHILRMELQQKVPYFDYEGFFRDQYVYADEREVLLPPMLTMTWKSSGVEPLVFYRRNRIFRKWVQKYEVTVTGFNLSPASLPTKATAPDSNAQLEVITDPDAYICDNAPLAAQALDELAQTYDWDHSAISDPAHVYWTWKNCWQYVLRRNFQKIYCEEFKYQ